MTKENSHNGWNYCRSSMRKPHWCMQQIRCLRVSFNTLQWSPSLWSRWWSTWSRWQQLRAFRRSRRAHPWPLIAPCFSSMTTKNSQRSSTTMLQATGSLGSVRDCLISVKISWIPHQLQRNRALLTSTFIAVSTIPECCKKDSHRQTISLLLSRKVYHHGCGVRNGGFSEWYGARLCGTTRDSSGDLSLWIPGERSCIVR